MKNPVQVYARAVKNRESRENLPGVENRLPLWDDRRLWRELEIAPNPE